MTWIETKQLYGILSKNDRNMVMYFGKSGHHYFFHLIVDQSNLTFS